MDNIITQPLSTTLQSSAALSRHALNIFRSSKNMVLNMTSLASFAMQESSCQVMLLAVVENKV
jgi:hypothetical protein